MALDWRSKYQPFDVHKAHTSSGIFYAGITIKTTVADGLILKKVEIDRDNMYTKIDLIKQDIKILLQLAVMGSKIRSLKIIISYLGYYPISSDFSINYPSILYHKSFQSIRCVLYLNFLGHHYTLLR